MLLHLMSQFLLSCARENCLFYLEAGNRDKENTTSKLSSIFVQKHFDFSFFIPHLSTHHAQCIKHFGFDCSCGLQKCQVPGLKCLISGMGGMEKEQCVFIVQMFKIWLLVLHGNFGTEAGREFSSSEPFR